MDFKRIVGHSEVIQKR